VKDLVVSTLRREGLQAPQSIDEDFDESQCYEGRTGDIVAVELFKVECRQTITGFGSYLNSGTSLKRSASWLGLSVLMFDFICTTMPNENVV